MGVMFWIFAACLALADLYWLANLLLILRMIRAVPVLADLRAPDPPRWPKLSLIVPACNEARTLEAAMQSRLREDYSDVEFVLIDDRSDDGSSEIVDRVAAADARVVPLHIRALPAEWLGKVHALHQGTQRATGEWLLFTDADVHFAPGTLRRAIAYCEQSGLDHLAVLPDLWPVSFLVDAALTSFARLFCLSVRPWALAHPASRASVGIGAFNLVRRSAFERTAGFEWLRLTVVDDMALGQMLRRSGARSRLVNGRGMVGLHFYHSLREAARGAEKSAILVVLRPWWLPLTTLGTLLLFVMEWSPFLAMGVVRAPLLLALAVSGLVTALVGVGILARWLRRPMLSALCIPLGALLMLLITWRAWLMGLRRGGIAWRGVLYPSKVLREHDRFEFI
ncbi:MAG TPA: glycosyltransferase family 2 protein [Phycisphaerae bacterium]|jgi:GT2 family glycosyltransferase